MNTYQLIFPNGIGGYLFGALAGPSNATKRQSIVLHLTGEKLPKSKCGFNAVRDLLFAKYNPQPGCLSSQESELIELLKREAQQ
jgi:hypothetical protein